MSRLNLEIFGEHVFADVPKDAKMGEEFNLPETHFYSGSVGRVNQFVERRGDRVRVRMEIVEGGPLPSQQRTTRPTRPAQSVQESTPARELATTQQQPLASAERRRRRRQQQQEQQNMGRDNPQAQTSNPDYQVEPWETLTERERVERGQGAFIADNSPLPQIVPFAHIGVPAVVPVVGAISTTVPRNQMVHQQLNQEMSMNLRNIPLLDGIVNQDAHRRQRMSQGYEPAERQELMIGDMGRSIDRSKGREGGDSKSEYQQHWEHMEYDTSREEGEALVVEEIRFVPNQGFVGVPVVKNTVVPTNASQTTAPTATSPRVYMPPTGVPIKPGRPTTSSGISRRRRK